MPLPAPTSAVHAPDGPDARFLLLLLPDFSMLPFGGFLDKLRFSADDEDFSQQRYCAWKILGLAGGHVVSSSGIAVQVQATPEQIQLADYDYLVVFGSRTAQRNLELSPSYAPLLRKAAAHGLTLVSIDNACFLLAQAGLLSGYQVAMHWRHVKEFREAFPRIRVLTDQIYCFDRQRISCAGGSAAIDVAVELLARRCGQARALKGLADMLVDETRGQLHSLKSLTQDAHAGRHLGRAIGLMRNLLAHKTSMEELAAQIGIGRRQLDRLFQDKFNSTAHDYWQELRLQHVRWRLLHSDHGLAVLADEVGMHDSSYLCKVFRQRFGTSPQALRKQPQDGDMPASLLQPIPINSNSANSVP